VLRWFWISVNFVFCVFGWEMLSSPKHIESISLFTGLSNMTKGDLSWNARMIGNMKVNQYNIEHYQNEEHKAYLIISMQKKHYTKFRALS
jgi:hypothetical protein